MYYYNFNVVFQEVPGEISLCFIISGCPLQCDGCHSPFLWKQENGYQLTKMIYYGILNKYRGYATCVLFMGGEWYNEVLIKYLRYALDIGYKTCLYTGLETVDPSILRYLTWVKTGKWDKTLGGLDSKITNQQFIDVKTKKLLNNLFIKPALCNRTSL